MSLSKELIMLILQFCQEEDLKRTAHMLEHETGVFFDMTYFENLVLSGNWDEAEKYLSGFTKLEDDKYSLKIYFEIRKQKFLEALDKKDRVRALDILVKDLKAFATSNKELYKEMTQLLTLDDFREHGCLSEYGDPLSARKGMMNELKNIIEEDPLFEDKLKLPPINKSRLRCLINQSLNWQHIHCSYPHPDLAMRTLFEDHQCPIPDLLRGQSVENKPLETAASVSHFSFPGTSAATQSVTSEGPGNLSDPTNPGAKDSSCTSQVKFSGTLDEVVSATPFAGQTDTSVFNNRDDLPKTLQRVLTEDSSPANMDFHPIQQNILLVGTIAGGIGLWDVSRGVKLLSRKFGVWKMKNISKIFTVALVKDPLVSVNRISWSPDGSLFGVAYSKHIVHLYSYHDGTDIQKHLEIDAHVGGVNDLAFCKPNEIPFLLTCGDDKLIQVWDVISGAKQYTFEGHGASVYAVCAHIKERIHFVFSTSMNGEIKAWLHDNMGPKVAFDAPGHCCTRMAYSADGRRLFSCGTTKDGKSFLIEWDEDEGYMKRIFKGLGNCSSGVVPFDTIKNLLVAGEDHLVKVWDMDHAELLTTIDADGDLPASPHVRFNKKGTLLAVTANHNKIKILANPLGHELLQTSENGPINAFAVLSETLRKLSINPISSAASVGAIKGGVSGVGSPRKACSGDANNPVDLIPELLAQLSEVLDVAELEINEHSRCHSLRLSSDVKIDQISRLVYTNAGDAILALSSNGIHLVWRWSTDETNLSGKATTKVAPELWRPRSGLQMTNDLNGVTLEECLPCFALSKNDFYVVSASSGMISLFNMMTFKKLTAFMPPPPVATSIAIYPQDNNILAIGTDDSDIVIYNTRSNKVIKKLKGHSKRITGLAFSTALNVLVSTGADAQIFMWDTNWWEKKKSKTMQFPISMLSSATSDTRVQFHHDQKHLLVTHETHLAIYEATALERLKQWVIRDACVPISHATFSCDSQLVYASLVDGTVLIFDAPDFQLRWELNPADYLPSDLSLTVYPVDIAAHPQEPNQFALGLTDGGVVVIEPPESQGKWPEVSSVDKASSSSMTYPAGYPLLQMHN